ncbi:MAG: UvrB/UvrC motif-containing protein [Patescibacteria group bacterium]
MKSMKYQALKKLKLPDTPGVYFFIKKTPAEEILYIGKAASLKDRVKSYFGDDILRTRGLHIANMVTLAQTVRFMKTDSVLEALLLENQLIKKWKPKYNTKEKDDKSFNYVVITKEKFPRVLIARGKNLGNKLKIKNFKLKIIFGPFPHGALLRDAMKIIRKIFPYRDNCLPAPQGPTSRTQDSPPSRGRACFNRQIGLCPGICTGEISGREYGKIIKNLKLFFEGRKKEIVDSLEKEMKFYAKEMQFEKADIIKKRIFALKHIKDIALVKNNFKESLTDNIFRIEAYDVAHLSGKNSVAVMTVVENGEVNKNEYRKFKLRTILESDDLASLEEVLKRRINHREWRMPDIVVVDGGANQKRRAEKVLEEASISVPTLAVVKNEFHKPRGILGEVKLARQYEKEILLANSEAHRFAIKYHRKLRDKIIIK